MAVKTENDLPENLKNIWQRAKAAYELKNFGYVISLLSGIVQQHREFLDARRLLRRAEIGLCRGKKSTFFGLDTSNLSLTGLKFGSGKSKDPAAAMDSAEKVLESDPFNIPANMALKEAAEALGLTEVATFALETLADGHSKDSKILHELGAHYSKLEMHEKAIEIYNRLLALNPSDLLAAKLGKDASARASIRAEGWDQAAEGVTDYRKLIKNIDEAQSLEQQSRVVKTEEIIEQQLAELHAKFQEEPQSVDLARKIAELCEQKEDHALAAEWFKYAAELTGNADVGLVRRASENNLKVIDRRLRELQSWLNSAPADDPERERVHEEIKTLTHERATILITEARKRVERNPTDLTLRCELGEHLTNDHRYDEAIPELQKALNNPNTRVRSAALLGTCYEAKGMDDLALEMYDEACEGLAGMDATKKDVLYRMALIHQRLGAQDKYLDALKQILRFDYTFRDVAARVEASYKR